jgi:hypothetical protein
MSKPIAALLTLALLGNLSCTALAAENEVVRDRWGVAGGAFFIQNAETVISLNALNGAIGTTIDLNKNLGMDDEYDTVKLEGYYRFNNHHAIVVDWYDIERAGQRTIDIDIEFGDFMFMANADITSQFDTQIFDVIYRYSFYNTEKVELAVLGGLHITSIDVSLQEVGGPGLFESASATAPLPVLGFHMRYNFLPKLSVTFDWKTLELEIGDFGGNFRDTSLVVEHRTFKNLGFGFGLQRFNVNLDAEDGQFSGSFENQWDGIFLYLMGYSH